MSITNHQSPILLFVTARGWNFWKPSIQLRPPFVNFVFVIQLLHLDLVLSKQVAGCIGRFVGGGKTTLKSTCFALSDPPNYLAASLKTTWPLKAVSLWFDRSDLNIRKFVHYYDNMIGLLSKHKVHIMSEHSTVEISKASAVVFWPYLCLMFLEICAIWKIYVHVGQSSIIQSSEWLLKIYFPIGQKVQAQKFLHEQWGGWLAGVWFCLIDFLIDRSIEQFFGMKIWSFP